MNKSSLKSFAIWARTELMNKVAIKLQLLGVEEDGITPGITMGSDIEINGILYNKKSYDSLTAKYDELGYDELVEESAYTWFNRMTALAYMECNGYIDEQMIYSTTSKIEPNIIDEYMDADFFDELSQETQENIHNLRDGNKLEEMYSLLIEEKCHELSKIMPFMFSKGGDYSELLFPAGLLLPNSFLVRLREEVESSIEEIELSDGENIRIVPVELIGWLYQFYNSEKKDEVFEGLKKNKKISKENIPAATQLFTPDWIVKYMVENSLGKLAMESLGVNEKLKDSWKYYIEAENKERNKIEKLKIEEIRILDPAMGSGHMLTYSFDVLFDIYDDLGWGKKDAILSILQNNIYGLEIDDRAGMLASFAIMMKAREKFARLFRVLDRLDKDENFSLNTLAIQESNSISEQTLNLINNEEFNNLKYLVETFKDAKEYGSILKIEKRDESEYREEVQKLKEKFKQQGQIGLFGGTWNFDEDINLLEILIHQAEVMGSKYDVTITNPPYMGGKGYTTTLKKYVEKEYKDSKSDLFAVFMEKCGEYTKENRYISMITMHSWMFLSSFEKMRNKLVEEKEITSMLHLGTRAFEEIGGEVVQTTTWITKKRTPIENGTFVRLVDYNNSQWKQNEFKNKENYHQTSQKDFSKIPGSPIAYWVSDRVKEIFDESEKLGDVGETKNGLSTTDNNRFVRYWSEVNKNNIGFKLGSVQEAKITDYKWFPYNKGGEFRKWSGNKEFIVDWFKNGKGIREAAKGASGGRIVSPESYFKKSISWSKVSSGSLALRKFEKGFIFDVAGTSLFLDENIENYILGILNSKLSKKFIEEISPTLNYETGQIRNVPIIKSERKKIKIIEKIDKCIDISKEEWDSRETSWDFTKNQLIENRAERIESSIEKYEDIWRERFLQMHSNEEELNRLFIDIYGLQDEMDEKVDLKDITLLKKETSLEKINNEELAMNNEYLSEAEIQQRKRLVFDRNELVKQFLSYAVGCIMGRYSIDKEGLIIANSDDELQITDSKYEVVGKDEEVKHKVANPKFIPDANGIIPIVGEDIFENDIVKKIEEFLSTVYGSDNLAENMQFIADNLGIKKGEKDEDCIRRYFIKDFYKDHLQRYKKRPIYWMMNSGKKEGFSALIYLHRYEETSIARVRTDYLIPYQEMLDNSRASYERTLLNEDIAPKDKKIIERSLKGIYAQLKELKDYANEVKHVADQRIGIDLDDGIKINYAKFGKILKKI